MNDARARTLMDAIEKDLVSLSAEEDKLKKQLSDVKASVAETRNHLENTIKAEYEKAASTFTLSSPSISSP
eukprot:m.588979 g.588979  ORF g.588979 m.588979 type:complete len:71 (+) comp22368_c0_seq14:168-380(+)